MAIYITNSPNPVRIVRLDALTDVTGQRWMCCIVDAVVGYPSAYLCFRGDLRRSSFDNLDRKINGRRDVWFKIPINQYGNALSTLRRLAVNPHKYKGILIPDLHIGSYKARLTSAPRWSADLVKTVKF